MNKQLKLFDKSDITEQTIIQGTKVILSCKGTGKTLFKGSNKIILPGSELNALKDFNFDSTWDTQEGFLGSVPSYDVALTRTTANSPVSHALDVPASKSPLTSGILSAFTGMDTTTDNNLHRIYKEYTRRIYLFCVGIDGCGIENSNVYKVSNTKFIAPYSYARFDPGTGYIDPTVTNCLIPFKVKPTSSDLTVAEREIYFGRSTVGTDVSYYFKRFDQDPIITRKYVNNSTELASIDDVWADNRISEATVIVTNKMSISETDCREYFTSTVGINSAKVNTLSLLSAVPYMGSDGFVYYTDVRPVTKFNFPNESLISTSKGIDITYYTYY